MSRRIDWPLIGVCLLVVGIFALLLWERDPSPPCMIMFSGRGACR